jgi:hypothetical protein
MKNELELLTELTTSYAERILNEVDYRIKLAFKNKGFDVYSWTPNEIKKRVKAASFVNGITTIYCDGIPICSYGFMTANDCVIKEVNGRFTAEYNYKFEEH